MFPFILSFVSINPRGAILKNINATHALMKTKTENSYLFLNPRISINVSLFVQYGVYNICKLFKLKRHLLRL